MRTRNGTRDRIQQPVQLEKLALLFWHTWLNRGVLLHASFRVLKSDCQSLLRDKSAQSQKNSQWERGCMFRVEANGGHLEGSLARGSSVIENMLLPVTLRQ